MWFIGVEVEQETSAPPPKKNPESAPDIRIIFYSKDQFTQFPDFCKFCINSLLINCNGHFRSLLKMHVDYDTKRKVYIRMRMFTAVFITAVK